MPKTTANLTGMTATQYQPQTATTPGTVTNTHTATLPAVYTTTTPPQTTSVSFENANAAQLHQLIIGN